MGWDEVRGIELTTSDFSVISTGAFGSLGADGRSFLDAGAVRVGWTDGMLAEFDLLGDIGSIASAVKICSESAGRCAAKGGGGS